MGGSHDHGRHGDEAAGSLGIAFLLNLGFTVIEVLGGFWTNSIAVISDAVHDLGDTLSLGLSWYFQRVSRRAPNAQHTYGYRRFGLLGGLITSAVLLVGLGFVLWHAVGRVSSPEPVHAPGMMLLAAIGILFNGAAVLRVRKGSSLTEKVVSWHLLEDLMGWVAVLAGAAVMAVWEVPIIDPILSIGIALFVFWNVFRNLRQFFAVFLQKVPEGFDVEAFEDALLGVPKVLAVHHTHSWSVDGERHVLTTHLVMRSDSTREDLIKAKKRVRERVDAHTFEHVTVDIELEGEVCVSARGHDHALNVAGKHLHHRT